jgi:hypothetical protein
MQVFNRSDFKRILELKLQEKNMINDSRGKHTFKLKNRGLTVQIPEVNDRKIQKFYEPKSKLFKMSDFSNFDAQENKFSRSFDIQVRNPVYVLKSKNAQQEASHKLQTSDFYAANALLNIRYPENEKVDTPTPFSDPRIFCGKRKFDEVSTKTWNIFNPQFRDRI